MADGSPALGDRRPSASTGIGVTVETVTDPTLLPALREEWSELLNASPRDRLFLTWEWLATWWRHLGAERQLRLTTVRRRGELIAIAPLVLSPPAVRRLTPFRRLEFLGAGSVGSDYLDLIVRGGFEREALWAMAEHLDQAGLPLDLARVNRAASSAAVLGRELTARGWTVSTHPGEICPYVNLSGLTWPSYLASVTASHRSNFKRRWNALQTQFGMRLELVTSEADRGQALMALVDLHHRRWRQRGGSDALHTGSLLAFHEDFTRLALERGWLRLFVMRLGDKPVASLYGFRYGQRFLFYQTGFDPDYAKQGVGQVVIGLTIKHALEEGLEEYDLLHGDERYKFDWARRVRELERIELFPPGIRGSVQRGIAELGRRARQRGRQWLAGMLAAGVTAGT
jgi:CelD/BcsL family acetyltransferase involved in cellulose biosynthesis